MKEYEAHDLYCWCAILKKVNYNKYSVWVSEAT